MTAKEPEVMVGMEFDKDDVVTVAVAKIEASIRGEVRKSKADVKNIDEQFKALDKEFQSEGDKSQPKTAKSKIPILAKAFKSAGLKLKSEIKTAISTYKDGMNTHRIFLNTLDEHGRPVESFQIFEILTTHTKRQKTILKTKDKLSEDRARRIQDGVDWKRRLQDLPAAERQMKAVVVESELRKSKDGKALVDLLTKQYTTTMKQIEM